MNLRTWLSLSAPLSLLLAACPADDTDPGESGGTESSTTSGPTSTGQSSSGQTSVATTSDEDPCMALVCGDPCFPSPCAQVEDEPRAAGDTNATGGGGSPTSGGDSAGDLAPCEAQVCDAGGLCVVASTFDPLTCGGATETDTGGIDYCADVECGGLCFPPCPDGGACEQTVCDPSGTCIGESVFDPNSCGGGSGSGSSSGSSSGGSGSESGSGSTTTGGAEQ